VNVIDVSAASPNGGSTYVVATPIGTLHVAALPNGSSDDPMVVAVRPEIISCLKDQPAYPMIKKFTWRVVTGNAAGGA
jgi:hypothetical protein